MLVASSAAHPTGRQRAHHSLIVRPSLGSTHIALERHAQIRGVLLRQCRLLHRDGPSAGRCPRPGHLPRPEPDGKAVSSAG